MPTVTSKKDPTNQALTRRRAFADGKRRLTRIRRRINDVIDSVSGEKVTQDIFVNDTTSLWIYDVETMNAVPRQISFIIDDELETVEEEPPRDWWFSSYDELSFRAGTMSENDSIEQMILAAALLVSIPHISQIIASQFYRDAVLLEVINSYVTYQSFSTGLAAMIHQEVINGLNSGLSRAEIKGRVRDRIAMSESRLKRIIDTELNRANNNARTALAIYYRDVIGVETAVLHVSALLPTTRPHHASRHGQIYTPEQQNSWWNQDANRINCHCSVRTVVIDKDGKPVADKFVKRINDQKPFFG